MCGTSIATSAPAKSATGRSSASGGDYCIFLDGDCILRPDFVATHRRLAEPGFFVTGNRVLLSRTLTEAILRERMEPETWGLATCSAQRRRGGVNRLLPALRLPLGPLRKLRTGAWEGARSCNLAVWRADLDRIDGFDAEFSGWGLEDSDLIVRLLHAGVRRKDGVFATGVLHLWHPESDRSRLADNRRRLDAVIASDRIRAGRGLSSLSLPPPRGEGGDPGLERGSRVGGIPPRLRGRVADRQREPGGGRPAIELPARPRILVVALRRLGDVLLTTPLSAACAGPGRMRPSTCWCSPTPPAFSPAIRTSMT